MAEYTGLSLEEVSDILNPQANANGGKIVLSNFDAVFSVGELLKPGRYELVFRTPPAASLYASGDKEIRFPISFSSFR